MRKIILNLAISIDGLIEGPNGEYDWCYADQDYGMANFMENTDTIIFGRKSYETMLQHDSNPFPDKQNIVCSRTLTNVAPSFTLINEHVEDAIKSIKQQEGKNIWLFGGAEMTTLLINADLVDELLLSIHPLLLGKGKSLFNNIADRVHYKLLGTQTYNTGLVQLHYQLIKK